MNLEELKNLLSKLKGTSEIIHFEEGLPIVFLIDENHDNPNNSIQANIENSFVLIEEANICLIGVESLCGGKKWDKESESYLEDDFPDKWDLKWINEYRNTNLQFFDAIKVNYENIIIGIENFYMHEKIFEVETEEERNQLHILRSKHFIKTLSEVYISRKLTENLIINCGLKHNSDIKGWIMDKSIQELTDVSFSYVRLNTIE